ncbi:MAG: ubiquitin-like small modifier protein 1 [Halobacteriaceae archaeon]
MELELRFFANFREAVGQKTVHRDFEDGLTVGEVLGAMETDYEGLDILEDGAVRPHINVLRNGREIQYLDGVDTVLEDGDALSVFPPVAGG